MINILYEDNHLLVVEKPVNIPSQKDESNDPDMLTLLKSDIKLRYNKPGDVFLGLVHRLDRPVGGVMVFARTSKSASRLSEQIRMHQFKKEYLAVVHGRLEEGTGKMEHYLMKDSSSNTVRTVSSKAAGAKQALLSYDLLDVSENFSLVHIQLQTGRSHQIRVQFSQSGHPLYGDQKYGAHLNKPGMQIALWSSRIELLHPTQGTAMSFKSMTPKEKPWNWFEVDLNRG